MESIHYAKRSTANVNERKRDIDRERENKKRKKNALKKCTKTAAHTIKTTLSQYQKKKKQNSQYWFGIVSFFSIVEKNATNKKNSTHLHPVKEQIKWEWFGTSICSHRTTIRKFQCTVYWQEQIQLLPQKAVRYRMNLARNKEDGKRYESLVFFCFALWALFFFRCLFFNPKLQHLICLHELTCVLCEEKYHRWFYCSLLRLRSCIITVSSVIFLLHFFFCCLPFRCA